MDSSDILQTDLDEANRVIGCLEAEVRRLEEEKQNWRELYNEECAKAQ